MSGLRSQRPAPSAPLPPASHHLSSPFELTLQEVAPGGDAVGRRDDGLVVFVPGGIPFDRVVVRLHSHTRSFARAELLQVVSPGPDRVVPACSLAVPQPGQTAAACGGCPLMALSRPAQLAAKQSWVERALRKLAVEVRPILAAAEPLGYRLRARLVVRGGRLSFAAAGSHRGAALSACPVLVPALEHALLHNSDELATALGEGGVLSGLCGWHAGQTAIHLAVELTRHSRRAVVRSALQRKLDRREIVGASVRSDATLSPREEEILGVSVVDLSAPTDRAASTGELGPLFASAAGFAQACAAGHTLLPALVADAACGPFSDGTRPALPQPHIVELFSGSGNLTRALRPLAAKLTCIEADPEAVARAQALFGNTLDLRAEPVENALLRLAAQGTPASTVVLDPPRAGARDAIALVPRLFAARVVYVSCDVMTLARDLAVLCDAGYRPRAVQPLDLMPHTAEVECVAVCDRDAAAGSTAT